jgi:hypothetical protein
VAISPERAGEMNFKEPEIDFREADRRYTELKRRFTTGSIGTKEFDTQRLRSMVRDDEGCWWVKGHTAGQWRYRAESGWVRGTSPGYQPPPTDDASDHCCSSNRPSRFPRGVRYAISARSYRTSSRIKRPTVKDPEQLATHDRNVRWHGPRDLEPESEKREAHYGHRKVR